MRFGLSVFQLTILPHPNPGLFPTKPVVRSDTRIPRFDILALCHPVPLCQASGAAQGGSYQQTMNDHHDRGMINTLTMQCNKAGSLVFHQHRCQRMAKKAGKKSAKTTTKKRIRVEYTKADVRELRVL
jgi:hypothetical protein